MSSWQETHEHLLTSFSNKIMLMKTMLSDEGEIFSDFILLDELKELIDHLDEEDIDMFKRTHLQ
jgi:hypothetical protein